MTPMNARTQRPAGPFSRGIALSLALSLLGASAPSFAQQPAGAQQDEGRLRFKRGVELFKEGDFRAALVEFKRAYEVAPSYRILYNLGQTSYELQDYAGALVAFERYLKEGGAELPADRRAEVEAEVKKLQGRVAYLTIEVNEPGALISVDDVQIGTSPLKEPLLVSAGQRRVAASRPPLLPASQLIELAGGDRTKLHLELVNPTVRSPSVPPSLPPASSSQAPAATPPPAPPPPPSSAGLWLGLGATVLLTGGAVTTGLLARSAQQDRDRELGRLPGDRSKIDSLADRAKTLALASDIMSGLALVGAGVTVYFAVRPGGTTTARVSPGGASLAVTF
jgi:tetratricopeptide (TPR) repeat protein